ncbi:copper resistance CopC family protein [uncultured Corynebacterium sp.]|uniref:copper resistance CopC family protein n=1 Tax=uncultured Corynebacterium sp. TaxID=159447 RepID=UPI0025CB87DB|nr:copper resistance CopC family protein [uncultured Corynebacterium sp.]
MSRLYRLAAVPVLAGGLLAVPVVAAPALLPAAVAHDALIGAQPSDGSVVDTAPEKLVLTFSAAPRGTYDTIALSKHGDNGGEKDVIFSGTPEIDRNVLTLALPGNVTLWDGVYTVGYQITSSDGHATRGSYDFTLTGQGEDPNPPADDASGSGDGGSGLPDWARPAMAVAGVIVLLGVLTTLVARLRKSDD